MPPCPPRPPAPLSRGPGPTGPRGFNASSRCSDPRLRQAPHACRPPSPRPSAPRARRLGREGGLGSREEGRARAAAGAGEGRAGLGETRRGGLGCACSSRLLGAELRAAGPATQLGDSERNWAPPHEPRCPHPQSSGPAASPRLPAAPSPRDAPRGRTRAAESGVPAPERRRGRRRANAGPWGAQTCGACGLRKVSPRVVGGCGGWESCLGTEELRFAK